MTFSNWFTNLNSDFWTTTNEEMEDITTLTVEDLRFLISHSESIGHTETAATYTAELARRAA